MSEFKNIPLTAAPTLPPSQAIEHIYTTEFGLPETVRETFPNDQKMAGTFVVFCIGDTVEVKARGLTPRQILRIVGLLISKII